MGTKLATSTSKDTSTSKATTVAGPSNWTQEEGREAYREFVRRANDVTAAAQHPELQQGNITAAQGYVAPLTGQQTQGVNDVFAHAFDYLPDYASARGAFGNAGDMYGRASDTLDQAQSMIDPARFSAEYNFGDGFTRSVDPVTGKQTIDFGAFTPQNLQHFQNPYDAIVREAGLADIDREQARQHLKDNDAAAKASAFGNTGRSVRDALTSELFDKNRITYSNQALKDEYDAAVKAREAERQAGILGIGMENSNLLAGEGAMANIGNSRSTIASGVGALGNDYANLGSSAQRAGLLAGSSEIGAAGLQAGKDQAVLDKAAALQDTKNTTAAQMELAKLGALGQTQQGSTTNQTGSTVGTTVSKTPVATPDSTGQWLGLASSLGGALLAPVTGGGSVAGASLASSLLSDENTKTDKSELDPKEEQALSAFQNVPVSTFKYKKKVQAAGLPGGTRTGPMAQDYAKQFGGNGKTIDVGNMMGHLTQAVKELDARTSHLRRKHG